jgi:hypothetical protein
MENPALRSARAKAAKLDTSDIGNDKRRALAIGRYLRQLHSQWTGNNESFIPKVRPALRKPRTELWDLWHKYPSTPVLMKAAGNVGRAYLMPGNISATEILSLVDEAATMLKS